MEIYKTISSELLNKVISETNQPNKIDILNGDYSKIKNTLI